MKIFNTESNNIKERICKLRSLMKEENITAYIITTDDFHNSEYVGEYFKAREYITGFSGSAGTALILEDEALLWTDGRYFIQAKEQLEGTGIKLMKSGEENVPNIGEYLEEVLSNSEKIAFDGRTVSTMWVEKLLETLEHKNIEIEYKKDLINGVWEDRPLLSACKVWELEADFVGKSSKEKIVEIRAKMEEKGADTFVLSSLDDIAWLLNLRGNDIEYNPVFLSYLVISRDKIFLFSNPKIFSEDILKKLEENGVLVMPYNSVYDFVEKIDSDCNVLVDKDRVNYTIIKSIPKGIKVINETNPTLLLKAIKTTEEIYNMKKAHVKDGIAVTKFMFWLKNNVGKEDITEISAAEKLEKLRCKQENYIGPSFEPIMGYGAHGAIIHYSATKETDVKIEKKGLLLADTGGQYLEGTTDITRTYALGELSIEEKRAYTAVLRGNLSLGAAKFKYGVRGINLDYLARSPLWEIGLDYNHGTGHGVGYLLNVHEGPNNIGWQQIKGRESCVLEEGMITSNEPGVYIEGQFGIRLENLILCKKSEETQYGKFMEFETLTMVPWDLEAIELEYMSDIEITLLNSYHKKVYETLSPYFVGEELEWLKQATRMVLKNTPIHRM